jgi:hypothetical protein
MGPPAETVAVPPVLFFATVAVVVDVVVVRLSDVLFLEVDDDVDLLVIAVLAGRRRLRRTGAPVFIREPPLLLDVLTLALTEAVGRPVRNAPRTSSSPSCACTLTLTPVKSTSKRGKTKILKRIE